MAADRLRRLQEDFAAAVTSGDASALDRHLAGSRLGVEVYRHAVAANADGALAAAFPVVARLVGADFFAEAARVHRLASPSTSGDLNRYGSGFAAFLAAYPHAAALPWLADVARLEWAWHESLGAADAQGLDHEALARVPPERQALLRFHLHPAVRLVRSPWPVLAIWEANQAGRDGTPAREEGADDVLLWRESNRVRLALLSPMEAGFVEAIGRGCALGDAVGESDRDLPGLLARLAGTGAICGFGLADAEGT